MRRAGVLAGVLAAAVWAGVALAQSAPGPGGGELRASLSARHQVVLSSEVAARVAELPLREGQAFEAGQTLVVFDCAAHRARLNRAQAFRDRARAQAAAAQRLDRSGVNSRLEVEVALAEAAAAEAELAAARVPVERCTVPAPYAGRVVELRVAAHQFVPEGGALLEIVDRGRLDVEIIAPSAWLAWIRPGHPFVLRIDETGRDYAARVERLSARVDPVSQTFKIHGRLEESHADLLPGMSGAVQIARPAAR